MEGQQLALFPTKETLSKSSTLTALHSSESNEHYTYPEYLDLTRDVFNITLDAASSLEANELHRIPKIFTIDNSALDKPWGTITKPENVWINPPGGKENNESMIKKFWFKAVEEWMCGNVNHLMFCCFNIELMQSAQIATPDCLPPQRFPFVVCRQRIKYLRLKDEWLRLLDAKIESAETQSEKFKLITQRYKVLKKEPYQGNNKFVSGDSPPSSTMFIYLPGGMTQEDKETNALDFEKTFSILGDVILPRRMP